MIYAAGTGALKSKEIDLVTAIKIAAEAGFKSIELNYGDYNISKRKEMIKKALRKNDLVNTVHLKHGQCFLGIVDPINPIAKKVTLRHFKDGLKTAKLLKSRALIMHPGQKYITDKDKLKGKIPDKIMQEIKEENLVAFSRLVRFAEKAKIPIGIENVPRYQFGNNPFDLLDMIKEIDSRYLTLCFDVGHYFSSYYHSKHKNETFSKVIPKLNPYHVHLYDDDLTLKDNHWMLGKGIINVKDIAKGLFKMSYHGFLLFEVQSLQAAIQSKMIFKKIWKKFEKEEE